MSVRYTLEGLYRESLRWGQEERLGKTLCFTEKNKQNRLKKNRIPYLTWLILRDYDSQY